MSNLSLLDYFNLKEVAPSSGTRACASDLTTISLQSLMTPINRRIIHLSDLHIGMNCNNTKPVPPIPAQQIQTIVNALKAAYPDEACDDHNPKPIIVITGDFVDHSDHADGSIKRDHLQEAADLLQPLINDNFTILAIPGNHDYSDAFDVSTMLRWQNQNILEPVGQILRDISRSAGKGPLAGQDSKLASGMSVTPNAIKNFQESALITSLNNKNTSTAGPEFNRNLLERWKARGAVYDLDFILIDGQDQRSQQMTAGQLREFIRSNVKSALQKEWDTPGDSLDGAKDKIAGAIGDEVAGFIDHPGDVMAKLNGAIDAAVEAVRPLIDTVLPLVGEAVLETITGIITAEVAVLVKVPPLYARYSMHDGTFRSSYAWLDNAGYQFLSDSVNRDIKNKALPIVAFHYWMNYSVPSQDRKGTGPAGIPATDPKGNPIFDPKGNPVKISDDVINSSDNAYHSELDVLKQLDQCHLLLAGHRHIRPPDELKKNGDNDVHPKQQPVPDENSGPASNSNFRDFTRPKNKLEEDPVPPFVLRGSLSYYSEAGATWPRADRWSDDKVAAHISWQTTRQTWVELSINLNTGQITATARGRDETSTPLPSHDWWR